MSEEKPKQPWCPRETRCWPEKENGGTRERFFTGENSKGNHNVRAKETRSETVGRNRGNVTGIQILKHKWKRKAIMLKQSRKI
jgi:hypothetical protein